MGNEGLSKFVGIGDVCLEIENGTRVVLKDVRHNPDMHLNLISVRKFANKRYCSSFIYDKWKLTKGSSLVARGEEHTTLYVM